MRQRILVVAKDMALRGRLARALKGAGYGVELAESVAHARRVGLKGFTLSLVAGEGLGPETGKLLGELETNSAKPLLIAVDDAAAAEPDSFRFSSEADLLARVAEAAGLQPVPEADAPEPVLRFDRYRFDIAGYALTDKAGRAIPLTRGEFSLLQEFVRRPGRVLSRDHLLNSLAGRDAESYDRSIDMLMVRLRRKIEADPKRPGLIVTIPGLGYKFTAKVAEATVANPVGTESKPEAVAPVPTAPAAPERRQLTVIHAALTGPALVAARHDPEDLQRLLAGFHAHCEAIMVQTGGAIDRLLSDGVLAYLGYPQADEYQAERAIRAALRLVETIGRIDTGQPATLQVRIGIATGLAVIGGPPGGASALGEAASVAAGLASRTGPNSVLIAARTRRLVGALFECRAHEPVMLDDVAEPVEAWQVTGEGAAEGRFEALRGMALAPLVGREEELALLLRRWEQAKSGKGKLVLISGEPGIGKSRLTRAVQDAIAEQPRVELRFFCSPHHQDSALYPIMAQIEHAAGFARDDTDEAKLTKLDALLARSDASDEALALIAELLSIATDQRERIQQMSPQARREKTLAALLAQFTGLAARQPILAIYEDLHWIDPSSRELLDRSIEQLERLPVLLLATFRPEFQPPWTGQPNATSLALNRLDRSDTAAMIADLAPKDGLPADVIQEIAERTDGVPLFIEEVTKAVVESGPHLAEALSSIPRPTLSVPATLHASLIARLDRLGPAARDTAQKGAAIGREFGYELIAAIAERPEPELRETLERLTSAGLLFARGAPPESTYQFKHALVQDTAYGTLVKAQRQKLHRSIATTLEERFPKAVETEPELMAWHLTEAGLAQPAVGYWLRAGERAARRSAHQEANVHLRNGLALLGALPDAPERARREIELQNKLGGILVALKGQAAPEVGKAYARAWHLCEQTGESAKLYPILLGLCNFHMVRAEFGRARELAERCQVIARREADPALLLGAHYLLTGFLAWSGEFEAARGQLVSALEVADREQHWSRASLSEFDLRVFVRAYGAHALWHLGYVEQADRLNEEAVALAREGGNPLDLAVALDYGAMFRQFARDHRAAYRMASEAIHVCAEHHFAYYSAWAVIIRSWAEATSGSADEGLAGLRRGLGEIEATGARLRRPYYLSLLADVLRQAGRPEEASAALEEALSTSATTGERWRDADLHRLRGCVLLSGPDRRVSDAEACFTTALTVARRQNALALELQAALDLARLWADRGRLREARELLAPIHDRFTEGFGTKDLKEAKALLDALQTARA